MKKRDILTGLFIAASLAVFSFIASVFPDGLERVAEDKKFMDRAWVCVRSPAPDYVFPGVKNERVTGSLAGISGVIIVFSLTAGVFKLVKGR